MSATCPVCANSSSGFPVVQGGVRDARDDYAPEALQCGDCTAVFLWPRMNGEAQRRFYETNAQIDRTHGQAFDWNDYTRKTRADVMRRVRFLESHLAPTDILLEVGCGYGFFLSEIAEHVGTAIGIEPGPDRRAFATGELGLDVRPPPLRDAGIEPASIDMACAFHVLEHVDRPVTFLSEIRDALRPGGRLVVEVPNVADLYNRLSPAYRAFHFQSAHLIYFDPATLRRVLEDSGFVIESLIGVQRYAFANALHWLTTGRPQLNRPSRLVNSGPAQAFDGLYRRCLELTGRSDTLLCIARNSRSSPETP